jgi:hypothetical protein
MTKNAVRLGSKLAMQAMKNKGENVAGKIFDFKGHEGERARVHIGEEGKFTIETRARQSLLICELDIPKRVFMQVDSGEVDDFGDHIFESREKDLDITKVMLKEYVNEKPEAIEK